MALMLLAVAVVVGAVVLFDTGFLGPAPVLLAGAGGLVLWSVMLWQPPRDRADQGRGRGGSR